MISKQLLFGLGFIIALFGCDPDSPGTGPGDGGLDPVYGRVDFNFPIPTSSLPAGKIRRVDLSLALTIDSLYRQQYCTAANVTDYKQVYSFSLLPGRYFYQAGVTCTCGGDSCLYAGFPGGQMSVWWTSGWVDVIKGKVVTKNLIFQ